MKILYLADNRNNENYGCRATSIALSQLIEKNHELTGTIYGYQTGSLDNTIFIRFLPKFIYQGLSLLPKWSKLRFVLSRLLQIIFRKYYRTIFDYVSHNPEKSIKNLLRMLPANSHLDSFNLLNYDFDSLVVNGEGTMIYSNPARRDALIYLMISYWALQLGKKVYFINSMFSECPRSGININTLKYSESVLQRVSQVTVRDYNSLDFIKKNLPSVIAIFQPDALFSWYDLVNDSQKIENGKYYFPFSYENNELFKNFDFTKPYICVGGSSSAAWNKEEATIRYTKLVNELKNALNIKIFIVISCLGDSFLYDVSKKTDTSFIPISINVIAAAKILANSMLLISGRYHPSIMASLNGTPCIFLDSNSHKTESLQAVLNYKQIRLFSALPKNQEIREILTLASDTLESGDSLRTSIKNTAYEMAKQSKNLDLNNVI